MQTSQSRKKFMKRKFTISQDDPFARIFDAKKIEEDLEVEPVCHDISINQLYDKNILNSDLKFTIASKDQEQLQFFPNFDGTQDSNNFEDHDSENQNGNETSEIDLEQDPKQWRNAAYWRLPENVRHAIDVAKMKQKHSEFFYRL